MLNKGKQNNLNNVRFAYLDNLRSFIIFLVVIHHAVVVNSGLVPWSYNERSPDFLTVIEDVFFGLILAYNQAWFMAVLFFLAAFFAVGSFERHGAMAFIRGRLFRLGIPLFVYMFIIYPFIEYYLAKYNTIRSFSVFFDNYVNHITSFLWLTSTRTIWFVEVLLLFTIVYAVLRSLHPRKVNPNQYRFKNMHCILLITILGISTFLIRLIFPMDKDFLNLHLASWSYYIIFFTIGVKIGENKCFDIIVDRKKHTLVNYGFFYKYTVIDNYNVGRRQRIHKRRIELAEFCLCGLGIILLCKFFVGSTHVF
jgi:hypothetical protein